MLDVELHRWVSRVVRRCCFVLNEVAFLELGSEGSD